MSLFLPYSIRLLKQYRKGVLDQVVTLSQNDYEDSMHPHKENTEYKKCKQILRDINRELLILEEL